VQWAKIKVGRHPASDVQRVRVAREALGPGVELFVDANGAYTPKQALAFAEAFADLDVTWLEEPVSSDDLEGLRRVRFRAPAGMVVTAGEYGYHPIDLRKLLDAGAVDVLQADVTRCLGFTGLHKVAAECESRGVPLSTHGAPALSAHAGACLTPIVHVEHFHDHVRLEDRLFRGVPEVRDGALCVNRGAPGHGLSLDTEAASLFALDA
jgi:L-alanine-DL-glutamate epimerase-like enolase superfamily enzyme